MNYYSFHIGDYAVHTRHLSLMEDLAYRRCLDIYYTRECALPADAAQVARLIGMREHVSDVEAILREFFVQEDLGDWVHFRCEKEIRKANAAADRARTNGKAGGRPQKTTEHPDSNPQETQRVFTGHPEESKSKAPNPNTQYPITEDKSSVAPQAARATRKCPKSFVITPDLIAWAASEAPGVSLETQTAILRDHTFKNAISDWPGAWRNWMRRAQKELFVSGGRGKSFRQQDADAGARRLEEMTGGLLRKDCNNFDFVDMEVSGATTITRD